MVPPGWALLGGMIAVLRLGLFSYWMNSYTGGGFIAALGGALVLGALPRLMKSLRFRYGLLMAVGIILLILTRPYEGMLLCFPVAVVLARWVFSPKSRPSRALLVRRAAFPIVLVFGHDRVARILRFSCVRKPVNPAIHSQSRDIRYCSLLCVAAPQSRARIQT